MRELEYSERELVPEVIAMGTCRILRLRRIGTTHLVEQNRFHRRVVDGTEVIDDNWQTVAIVKPDGKDKSPRAEAMEWMCRANHQIMQMWNTQRAASTNGALARRTD